MLLDGQERASVMSAIACRASLPIILPEFLALKTRTAAFVALGDAW